MEISPIPDAELSNFTNINISLGGKFQPPLPVNLSILAGFLVKNNSKLTINIKGGFKRQIETGDLDAQLRKNYFDMEQTRKQIYILEKLINNKYCFIISQVLEFNNIEYIFRNNTDIGNEFKAKIKEFSLEAGYDFELINNNEIKIISKERSFWAYYANKKNIKELQNIYEDKLERLKNLQKKEQLSNLVKIIENEKINLNKKIINDLDYNGNALIESLNFINKLENQIKDEELRINESSQNLKNIKEKLFLDEFDENLNIIFENMDY